MRRSIDLGVQIGEIEKKAGAWYSVQGSKIGRAKANALKITGKRSQAIADEIEKAISRLNCCPSCQPQANAAAEKPVLDAAASKLFRMFGARSWKRRRKARRRLRWFAARREHSRLNAAQVATSAALRPRCVRRHWISFEGRWGCQ